MSLIFMPCSVTRRLSQSEDGIEIENSYYVVYTGEPAFGGNWAAAVTLDDIRNHEQTPKIGDPHPVLGPTCTVVGVTVEPWMQQPHVFLLVVRYSTTGNRGEAVEPNPLDRPPEIVGYRYEVIQREATYGYRIRGDGSEEFAPLLTSSQELYPAPIYVDEYEPVILVRRWEPFPWDVGGAMTWRGAINKYAFSLFGYTFEPRTCVISDIQPELRSEGGMRVMEVTYGFKASDHLLEKRPDLGTRELAEDYSGPHVGWAPIIDASGQPVTQPVALDGAGRRSQTGIPATLTFRVRRELDFRMLGFPP